MTSVFVDYLLEMLVPLGGVSARRMFGGVGIFYHDLMFGIVDEDILYLKVDDSTKDQFIRLGLEPFTYTRQGKPCALAYYQAPAEALDEAEELCRWARTAVDVALRAAKK